MSFWMNMFFVFVIRTLADLTEEENATTPIKQSFGFAGTDRKYCHGCGQLMTAENKMYGINADGSRSEEYCKTCNSSKKARIMANWT